MKSFGDLGLDWITVLYTILIGIAVYLICFVLYPPLIKWLKKKGYVGYDIHKKDRPATAESGGLGITIGISIGVISVGLLVPSLRNEMIVFLATVWFSAFIGWVDDRIEFHSITKIILMILTGAPVFIANYIGFIHLPSPVLPVLGKVRLTLLYPLSVPLIVAIMTNTVNMLEGYNGEGSGTTSIATFFLIICAIIAESSEGLLFGIPVLFSILAFYKYNKYPAKVFPGDVGTLTIGAALAMLGILGGLEVDMAIVVLPQIFNSFYVLASIHGWIKMKSIKDEIKVPDIWIDDDEYIHASEDNNAPLTLPRLLTAGSPLKEDELVRYFLYLSVISGLFAVIAEFIRQAAVIERIIPRWLSYLTVALCILGYIYIVYKHRRLFELSVIMIVLLLIGLLLFYLIDIFIVTDPLNWLESLALGGLTLLGWYYITIRHFWNTIDKMKNSSDYVAQPRDDKKSEKEDDKERA